MKILNKIIRYLTNSIIYKILSAVIIYSVVMLFVVNVSVKDKITHLEKSLIGDRLVSDINYIEDLINDDENAKWNVKNDAIYYGDVLIGDGTEEKANLKPFLEHLDKTGTFAYVFKLDEDAELGYVEKTKTSDGYEEGHYLRIAGSTKSPEGESIVGTYIAKNVADALDKEGSYSGEANVAGGRIFCLYNVIRDKDENIIGAIVVGRNISELNEHIIKFSNSIFITVLTNTLLCLFILYLILKRLVASLGDIKKYIEPLEKGVIPEKPLILNTKDELSLISDSINKMVSYMKENAQLKKKSETDALTGLKNRLAYDQYSEETYRFMTEKYKEEKQKFGIGILDIDFFKEFNDNYGHKIGDECIKKIAKVMDNFCDEEEGISCYRYGGDEFAIIYRNVSKNKIEETMENIRKNICELKISHEHSKISNIVTVTQGTCYGNFNPKYTINNYFNKADEALYKAKAKGKNCYAIEKMEK